MLFNISLSFLACSHMLSEILNSQYFDKIFNENLHIYIHGSIVGSLKYRRMFFQILLSYLACSQIWLNLHVNHHHFGYKTKLPPQKKGTSPFLWVSLLRWQQVFFFKLVRFCQKKKLKMENWKWNYFGGFQLPEVRERKCKNCQNSRFIECFHYVAWS